MSDALNSTDLVESIKRRASLPENQATYTKQDFLDFATEELRLDIVPSVMSLHEDFFLFEKLITTTDDREYEIPSRAVGNKLKDVQLLRRGSTEADDYYIELTRTSIGKRFDRYDTANLYRFYLKNNKVVFENQVGPQDAGFISMVFYIKPSKLVDEDRVGIITGINATTGEIILSELPEHFNTTITYDFYKADSPHNVLDIDLTATTVNAATNSITFVPADLPKHLKVGDHLAQAGECSIPQIPTELQIMLAQLVACRILEAQGDTEGLRNALTKLAQMKEAAGFIIDNRVEEAPQKIVNRHGFIRNNKTYKNRS